MATPYLSEIRIFSYGLVPRNWAQCNGQLLPINSNEALFSLIGTTYGGDGRTTFAVPNLRGQVPIHMGAAVSGTNYTEGERAGAAIVQIDSSTLPDHNHMVQANSQANTNVPSSSTVPGGGGAAGYGTSPAFAMSTSIIGYAGESAAHNNLQPYLPLNFCICVSGIFPVRG